MYWSRIQSSSVLRMMPPLGWKKINPGPGKLLNTEQIQLLAKLAMVALLRFFETLQVLFEFLLV